MTPREIRVILPPNLGACRATGHCYNNDINVGVSKKQSFIRNDGIKTVVVGVEIR